MRSELWIDGAWREGAGERIRSTDPVTDEIVWEGAAASVSDVEAAAAAGAKAFPDWAARPLSERVDIARAFARIVEARAGDLAALIGREMGKVRWDGESEASSVVAKIAISVRAQAERAGEHEVRTRFGRLELSHRPHGLLAVFGPFNFPAHLPNGHIAPALLAGDTILFKPSELTPGVGAFVAAAWEEAGLPAGVLNLVQGGSDVGAALLDAPDLKGVLFTGSARTGAAIHRHFAGRPEVLLALEMGGNNPLIVWPPFGVEAAVNISAQSAFVTTGQRCTCARRLIVPDNAEGARFVGALAAFSRAIVRGAWNAEPQPFMGPLVNVRAAESVIAFADALAKRGAKVIVSPEREGAFVAPALIDVTGIAALDEECFGPLLQIVRAPTFEAAVAIANETRFGLAAGLLSEDETLWTRLRTRARAGVLNWNRPTTGASGGLPFGGVGVSGSLRPGAYYAADYAAYPVASQAAEKLIGLPAPGLPG